MPRIKKAKTLKARETKTKRPPLAPADKNQLRGLIIKGRDNDEIMKEMGSKITIHNIKNTRHALKHEMGDAA
jgi:hypothetical protein